MGASTLGVLTQHTSTAGGDLERLVRELGNAVAPLEGKFQGQARATFDRFKNHTDEIAVELHSALNAVLTGIDGMNRAFIEGEDAQIEQTHAAESGSAFEAARFGGVR